ncbi:MAG: Zn-dependent alcohol dehydrogenase [Candidatus Latescibacteria bacterium]|nr:Zn-dependent alcohol dehydrogenase [Candidatus Latescibacterota bacterium]
MKASVLFKQGEPIRVEDVSLAPPKEDEVLVRMAASGVCHSCLHAADGNWKGVPVPIVLGDEGAGVVEEVGPGVRDLKPGDHVILSWAPTCGRCHYCVIGRPNLCERRRPGQGVLLDGTSRMSLNGQTVHHYGYVATYASHSVMPESCAIPIRKDMPLDKAALIGCSVMTGVGAVLNTAQVPAGASVAVFGVGGIGLNVVQGGALVAAHPVIGVDVRPNKLDYARKMGATHGVDASKEDPVKAIKDITGRGADYAFVAVGNAKAVEQAWDCLAPGGMCVLIGVPATGSTVTFEVSRLQSGERTMRGCSYGSARTREDFPRMVDLYLGGRLKIDELITRRYALEEINEANRALAEGEVARGLIVF